MILLSCLFIIQLAAAWDKRAQITNKIYHVIPMLYSFSDPILPSQLPLKQLFMQKKRYRPQENSIFIHLFTAASEKTIFFFSFL